jgi:hypothetical protein
MVTAPLGGKSHPLLPLSGGVRFAVLGGGQDADDVTHGRNRG